MRKTPLATIWILSFIIMVIYADPYEIMFWFSFAVFAWCSLYIEKHNKRLEHDKDE